MPFLRGICGTVVLGLCCLGCGGGDDGFKTAKELGTATAPLPEEDHAHAAPHGGTLVELGEHAANAELVIDPAAGQLKIYLLDAHAESPIEPAQTELKVSLTPEGKSEALALTLTYSAEEKAFAVTAEELKGVDHFDIAIEKVEAGGKEYTSISGHVHPEEADEHGAHGHEEGHDDHKKAGDKPAH